MKTPHTCFAMLIVLAAIVTPAGYSQSQKTIAWPQVSMLNPSHARSDSPNHHLVDRLEQIEIESIQVEGRSIILGEPFTASDDWLGNTRFRIKNISGQRLEFVQITLVLPEITEGSPQLPFICTQCRVDKKQIPIEPGAEVDLTLSVPIYSWAKGVIAQKASLASITNARILHAEAKAPEDMSWSSDCVKTSDPKNACPQTKP